MLDDFYGPLLLMRMPTPVTHNKAGANYKSEVTHLAYSPREALDEWIQICEGICALGGDALFMFEEEDALFLDHEVLQIDPEGQVALPHGGQALGHVDQVLTGRVFTANGPWVRVVDGKLQALLPQMLPHRVDELPYYHEMLRLLADETRLALRVEQNPHRWEGLADVAVVEGTACMTYTRKGHYDSASPGKTLRSSREGTNAAARFGEVRDAPCLALKYPHFHGDTAHFAVRVAGGEVATHLFQYPGAFDQAELEQLRRALQGRITFHPIGPDDAVDAYAANSRQVQNGLLVPEQVSSSFRQQISTLDLEVLPVKLEELFGKAGGGPACATLQLPNNLAVPKDSKLRYSNSRHAVQQHRARVPQRVDVDTAFFKGRQRG